MCVLEPSKSERDITVILLQHCNRAMRFDHFQFTVSTYHVLLRHCVTPRSTLRLEASQQKHSSLSAYLLYKAAISR